MEHVFWIRITIPELDKRKSNAPLNYTEKSVIQ